jgi:hypothetical protein
VVRTVRADQAAEAGTRPEEPEDDWHRFLEVTLTPITSMVASILSLAVGDQRRKA